jgi:23S rRNA (cytidine1920-2'-O)/16S rRNA (cytidine1409-2'-O)-methyltransferase
MHVLLPEKVSLVTIDVAWTRQRNILPAARKIVGDDGRIVTLIKPHYESDKTLLRDGVLPAEQVAGVVEKVKNDIRAAGFEVIRVVQSPIKGGEGNVEVLAELRPL